MAKALVVHPLLNMKSFGMCSLEAMDIKVFRTVESVSGISLSWTRGH